MILLGDCLEHMRSMDANSIDAIVTDPPYGLSFMGKKWDHDVPPVEVWAECLRVLKPGGHLLAFAGTRTQHRMAARIEDAGFEIRDMIAWVYGSGFPKSLDVSKAIDKAAGARGHDSVGFNAAGIGKSNGGSKFRSDHPDYVKPVAITEAAQQWQGWGTALKPALEPITMARKPLVGTVAANVLAHGTGALNIDGCRVDATGDAQLAEKYASVQNAGRRENNVYGSDSRDRAGAAPHQAGRFPANLIHDGSEEVTGLFPHGGAHGGKGRFVQHAWAGREATEQSIERSEGSAARFFYCAKASKRDRDAGNNHPTVKPTDLMRYLCRLVTPPGGIVLDPFMGSGSTGRGAIAEGFQFIGIELDPEYAAIAEARIKVVQPRLSLGGAA